MAKNKLCDLNDHLFMQLERLNDEDLTPEQLELEIKRAKAITGVASNIVGLQKTVVEAQKVMCEYGYESNTKTLNSLKAICEN